MSEHELFVKPRDELLRLARELGIPGAQGMTKTQLVYAIAAAQTAQTSGSIWIPTSKLIFKKAGQKQNAILRNQTRRAMRLGLEVMDRVKAFEMAPGLQEVTLKAKGSLSVPIQFAPRKEGAAFSRSAIYRAGMRVWDLEAKKIVGFIDLSGVSIGRVPYKKVSCIMYPAPSVASPRGNSPPSISISVTPEAVAPGGVVHVSYSVTGADEVWESWGHPGEEVLEDGTFTDAGSWGSSETSAHEREYDVELARTTFFEIYARNEDGSAFATVVARVLVRIGYHNARTPGVVYRSELDDLRDYLESIEDRLNDGCIRDNENLDHFDDPYLRGDLTDDILAAMRDLVIYTSPEQLPSAYQDTSRLCECNRGCVYGQTPEDRSFVALCLELGADDLTLLHELYHYAADHDWDSEEKAFAISNCDPITHRAGCFLSDEDCGG